MVISEEVEFAGTAIRAEKKNDNDVVHILPREKRVQAFMELKKKDKKRTPSLVRDGQFPAEMVSKPSSKSNKTKERCCGQR